MLIDRLKQHHIILASRSPRRQFLLKEAGIDFDISPVEVDESYPPHLRGHDIALYLCRLKADAFDAGAFNDHTLLITADTLVWLHNKMLSKPDGYESAYRMLDRLSGNKHTVFTGVCLRSKGKTVTFYEASDVYFRKLREEEIRHYLDTCKPFDKAGAYGIQEWIGYIGIEKIEGCFYNVMGLPMPRLYKELEKFIGG